MVWWFDQSKLPNSNGKNWIGLGFCSIRIRLNFRKIKNLGWFVGWELFVWINPTNLTYSRIGFVGWQLFVWVNSTNVTNLKIGLQLNHTFKIIMKIKNIWRL